jgi:hypothetical protein
MVTKIPTLLALLSLLAFMGTTSAITVSYSDGSIKEVDDDTLQDLRAQQPFLIVPNPAPVGYKHGLFMTIKRGPQTYVRSLSFGSWDTPTIPPQSSHDRTRYKEYGCDLTVLPGTMVIFRTRLYTRVYTADTTTTVHTFPLYVWWDIKWEVQSFNGTQNAVFGMDGRAIPIPTTSVIVPLPTKGIVFLNIGDTSCCISIWARGKRVERKCATQRYISLEAEGVSMECGPNQGPYVDVWTNGDKQLFTPGQTALDPPSALGILTVPANYTLETWDMDGHTFIFGPGHSYPGDNYAMGVVTHMRIRKSNDVPTYPYLYELTFRRPLYLPMGISKVGRSGLWEYHGSTMTRLYVPIGMSVTVYKHRFFDKHGVNPRVWKYGPGDHSICYSILDTPIIGLVVEQEEQKQ